MLIFRFACPVFGNQNDTTQLGIRFPDTAVSRWGSDDWQCWGGRDGAHGPCASPQARLNCKHCGKPVIDVRVGMQYFSEYSNVQQCPHCGNLDYHFVKPFSSFKVLEAYWWKLCFGNSYFIDIITLLHIFSRKTFCDGNFFSNLKENSFVYVATKMGAAPCPLLTPSVSLWSWPEP